MVFFRYLFYNQYAEISRRGGNARQAQFNTIILSTAVFTLLLIGCFILYDKFHAGWLDSDPAISLMGGKAVGKLLGAVVGVVIFFILKFLIGSQSWYDRNVDAFESMSPDQQTRASKKGLRYFFIACIPVIVLILWVLASSLF